MLAGHRRLVNARALRSNPRSAAILRAQPNSPTQSAESTRWQKQAETNAALVAVAASSSCATAWWRWLLCPTRL
jgi:hypothetical protein